MPSGWFITIEGPDGSGKSTLIRGLSRLLRRAGYAVRQTREPGGSPIAEKIRSILLSTRSAALTAEAELLLFEAARRQHLFETVEPALVRGEVVLCDRFADSTTAYQGAGRAIASEKVAWLNAFACQGRKPDLTLVLDLDPAVGLWRAGRLKGRVDRMEIAGLSFHQRVRKAFLKTAKKEPRRIKVIQVANKDASVVLEEAWAKVALKLKRSQRNKSK